MTKFFDYVWRFNALAIAAASILMLIITASFLSQSFRGTRSSQIESRQEWVDRKPDQKVIFALGTGDFKQGSNFVRIPLNKIIAPEPLSIKGYDKVLAVNYVFIDTQTGVARWLTNGGDQIFALENTLLEPTDSSTPITKGKAISHVYAVWEKDTDGNGNLTSQDDSSIAASALDGSGYVIVKSGLGEVELFRQVSADRFMVVHRKNSETFTELFSVTPFAHISTTPIPRMKDN